MKLRLDLRLNDKKTTATAPSVPEEFSPTSITSLEGMWEVESLSALTEDDSIPQWNDLSGNNNHFTQATGIKQPTYKTTYVKIDTDQWMSANGTSLNGIFQGESTIYLVADITMSNQLAGCQLSKTFEYQGLTIVFDALDQAFIFRNNFANTTETENKWLDNAFSIAGTFKNFAFYHDAPNRDLAIKISGTTYTPPFVTKTDTYGTFDDSGQVLRIGSSVINDWATGYMNISALYIFSSILTGTDDSNMVTYINTKYGV